jgi:uncharacterized membrane protein YdjX (TVP38/TMEM64 family)
MIVLKLVCFLLLIRITVQFRPQWSAMQLSRRHTEGVFIRESCNEIASRSSLYTTLHDSDLDIEHIENLSITDIESSEDAGKTNLLYAGAAAVALAGGLVAFMGQLGDSTVDLGVTLQNVADKIESLGPQGVIYFGIAYTIAEILAIPATPLTAMSGYLFGLIPGTLVVLTSATIAAALSFYIGRGLLRDWAEEIAKKNAKWRAINKAVSKDGFRVVLLLRLSPLLPFALSNYLYALTSIGFKDFIMATFLGFAPGTFGIVYSGTMGRSIFGGDGTPWYVYAGGAALIFFFAQTIAKVASEALANLEEEEAI